MLNGDCKIGEACFIGSGTVVNNGIEITNNCIVGSGSLVNSNISNAGTYIGTPIRRIK